MSALLGTTCGFSPPSSRTQLHVSCIERNLDSNPSVTYRYTSTDTRRELQLSMNSLFRLPLVTEPSYVRFQLPFDLAQFPKALEEFKCARR